MTLKRERMLLLAIDTSSPIGSVALRDEKRLVGLLTACVKSTHSEGLMPAVDSLLHRTGRDVSELTALACTSGPGSYTGLRVGMATGQGIAFALGLPCVALSTLDVFAESVPYAAYPLCPILPARKGWLYARMYRRQNGEILPCTDELYVQPDELIKRIQEPMIFYGPGLESYRSDLRETLGSLFFELPCVWDVPRADILAELAFRKLRNGGGMEPARLLPHYLGPSQAEVNWKQRQHG
jgi:tRNA threonylcarbamoyladenosine biosynthesis protein TsaB